MFCIVGLSCSEFTIQNIHFLPLRYLLIKIVDEIHLRMKSNASSSVVFFVHDKISKDPGSRLNLEIYNEQRTSI